MKLHQAKSAGLNIFTGYGEGHVLINGQRHDGNLLVTAEEVHPWVVDGFEALQAADFELALGFTPEVVLFGSGAKLRFPHPRLTAALVNAGIGVEVMDTQAACRTFNILMAEDRKVLALLLT